MYIHMFIHIIYIVCIIFYIVYNSHENRCNRMFVAALFVRPQIGNNPNAHHSIMDNLWHIYTMENHNNENDHTIHGWISERSVWFHLHNVQCQAKLLHPGHWDRGSWEGVWEWRLRGWLVFSFCCWLHRLFSLWKPRHVCTFPYECCKVYYIPL